MIYFDYAYVNCSQRASIQIASLQEQLSIIANQRDQALAQVSTLEDKVQQHSASVSKLQLVLEQMQRGRYLIFLYPSIDLFVFNNSSSCNMECWIMKLTLVICINSRMS